MTGPIIALLLLCLVLFIWAVTLTLMFIHKNNNDNHNGANDNNDDDQGNHDTAVLFALQYDPEGMRVMRKVLEIVGNTARKNGIRLYPTFGTLIGMVRNNEPSPLIFDDDIDLMVDLADIDRLKELVKLPEIANFLNVIININMFQFSLKDTEFKQYHLDIFYLNGYNNSTKTLNDDMLTVVTSEEGKPSGCQLMAGVQIQRSVLAKAQYVTFWELDDIFIAPDIERCHELVKRIYGSDVLEYSIIWTRKHNPESPKTSVTVALDDYPQLRQVPVPQGGF